MFATSKSIIIVTLLLYISALLSVFLSAHVEGYETLLKIVTKENSLFETLSVLMLFFISVYAISCVIKSRKLLNTLTIGTILSFAFITFIAGMEEISWGQHLFHFQSSDFFLQENLQKETNLHNLINGNLFSSIIYSTIYTLFIFIPLLYKLFKSHLQRYRWLHYFDINPHTILVALFASVFQLYFYNDFGVLLDMLMHLIALGLFAIFLYRHQSSLGLKLHYALLLFATLLSMLSCEVYSFLNMQYEIREMFVIWATLLIFSELLEREKRSSL